MVFFIFIFMLYCPFCKKEFDPSRHIYACKQRDKTLSNEEIRYQHLLFNYPEIAQKEIFIEKYITNQYSYPELKRKYGLDYRAIAFLIKHFKIPSRDIRISMNLFKTREKVKKTCYKKYGAINPLSKNTDPYHKRNQTVLQKYGVKNIFQYDEIIQRIHSDKYYLEKYGLNFGDFKKKQMKYIWSHLTDEEKNHWLNISLHGEKSRRNNTPSTSKLETRIQSILDRSKIVYTKPFFIHPYWYDFYLNEFKIILEIQGDYWHANPSMYYPDDLIHYISTKITAQNIWDKDKKKADIAKQKGFLVIYIWESEMIILNEKELKSLIIQKLREIDANHIY